MNDDESLGDFFDRYPVLGRIDEYFLYMQHAFIVAIGNADIRREATLKLKKTNWYTEVRQAAIIEKNTLIGVRMIHNIRVKNIIGICLVLAWFIFFVYVTLIKRTQSDMPIYNLQLFWCIWEAWTTKNPLDWYFIVGNVSLFIPLGMMLPLCFDRMKVWWWTLLFGFGISLGVELIQLVFRLGLFEFDDIFNNTLGTLLGYGLFVFYMGLFRREWKGRSVESVLLLFVWIIVVAFLIVALCAGQPVFDRFMQGFSLFA